MTIIKAPIELGDKAEIQDTELNKSGRFLKPIVPSIASLIANRFFYSKLDPGQKQEMVALVKEAIAMSSHDLCRAESVIKEEINNSSKMGLNETTRSKENAFHLAFIETIQEELGYRKREGNKRGAERQLDHDVTKKRRINPRPSL